MRVRDGGAWRTAGRGQVRVDGAWRNLTRALVHTGGAWRNLATFVPPLAATIPGSAFGQISGSGVVVTNAVTATPMGGFAPYTYAWTRTSGAAANVTSPTSATTTFNLFLAAPANTSATFQCVVTDAFGTAVSASITATFSAINFS